MRLLDELLANARRHAVLRSTRGGPDVPAITISELEAIVGVLASHARGGRAVCGEGGMNGYFVGEDAHGDVGVWRESGDYPVPVLGRSDLRDDPELWDYLVSALPRKGAS